MCSQISRRKPPRVGSAWAQTQDAEDEEAAGNDEIWSPGFVSGRQKSVLTLRKKHITNGMFQPRGFPEDYHDSHDSETDQENGEKMQAIGRGLAATASQGMSLGDCPL